MEKSRSSIVRLAPLFALTLLSLSLFSAPSLTAFATSCSPAGTTGLTAYIVVSTNGQVLTPAKLGTAKVNATGCNVGIYVAPNTKGVLISGLIITGATDHGIFVQDASSATIAHNTVTGNGVAKTAGIAEDKAIELVGTSDSIVSDNTVTFNFADGGIGIADDGAIDPGAPLSSGSTPIASTANTVSGNYVKDNAAGCGIVVAAYNAGGGVGNNLVEDNTVIGNSVLDSAIKGFVGGIVVAADTPGTSVWSNTVKDNVVNGSLIPGIVIHSNAPGDAVKSTEIIDNTLTYNGVETTNSFEPHMPAAIMVVSEIPHGGATITGTDIRANYANNNVYSVWYCNTSPSITSQQGPVQNIGVCQATQPPPTSVPQFPLGAFGLVAVLATGFVLLALMRRRMLLSPVRSSV